MDGARAGVGATAGAEGSPASGGSEYSRAAVFGQVVIGPPGAGKTTYCNGMQQFMTALGRPCKIVNLDPANDGLPFDCDIDVMDLICLEDVMEEFGLGPNGGLVYCLEFLEENLDWLIEQLAAHPNTYFLFDCPGQVELYTHHESLTHILERLVKAGHRLTAVHLVDAQHCSDSGHFIAMALTSLATMMRLELPHINVLSKVDLFQRFGEPPLELEAYTSASDLELMAELVGRRPRDADIPAHLDVDAVFDEEYGEYAEGGEQAAGAGDAETPAPPATTFAARFRKLNRAIVEVVNEFSMVGYRALNIMDKDSVAALVQVIDKSNGYAVGYLGEPAKDLASMPEFSEWNEEVAMERIARTREIEGVAREVVREEAVRGVRATPSGGGGGGGDGAARTVGSRSVGKA